MRTSGWIGEERREEKEEMVGGGGRIEETSGGIKLEEMDSQGDRLSRGWKRED